MKIDCLQHTSNGQMAEQIPVQLQSLMSPLAKLVTRSVLDLHYLAKGSGEGYKEYVCVYYLFIKFEVRNAVFALSQTHTWAG